MTISALGPQRRVPHERSGSVLFGSVASDALQLVSGIEWKVGPIVVEVVDTEVANPVAGGAVSVTELPPVRIDRGVTRGTVGPLESEDQPGGAGGSYARRVTGLADDGLMCTVQREFRALVHPEVERARPPGLLGVTAATVWAVLRLSEISVVVVRVA